MKKPLLPIFSILFALSISACAEKDNLLPQRPIIPDDNVEQPDSVDTPENVRYKSAMGLVMCGYQGWFNTPTDGANLRWKHYELHGKFQPGCCSIDLWPDVSEYEKTYQTPFSFKDGSVAKVFSSRDASTIDVHFRWMKEYGIDGVYVQRFATNLRNTALRSNSTGILDGCVLAAEKYGRAVCLMYDLSGLKRNEIYLVKEDWKDLVKNHHLTDRENNHYLYHNGRPLVAIWGVGFSGDNRDYGLDGCQELIDFFKRQGCSILLGVPSKFHSLSADCTSDPKATEIFKQADVIFPWFVGRYKSHDYEKFRRDVIEKHIQWCKRNNIDYIVDAFPGFSWYNLQDGRSPFASIPRMKGEFLWQQLSGGVRTGAKSIYISMFDEIDEGTAIFKCINEPPVGDSGEKLFIDYEGLPSDHYLWIAGLGGKLLRNEISPTLKLPERK